MTKNDLKHWKQTLNSIVPKELVTPEVVALRDQQNEMFNLMAKKNADYGNAFNEGCNDLGVKYGWARIYDKAKRDIELISDEFAGNYNHNIEDESLFDTIQDSGNYCNMILDWKSNIEDSISSTGSVQQKRMYIDIYQCISNGSSLLINEKDKDVTKEILDTYGIDNLCRDNNGYVYIENVDGEYVVVTDKQQNQVRIISKSYFQTLLKTNSHD